MEDLRLKISNQIDEGSKRRNKELVRITFESYKDPRTGSILISSLDSALRNLGMKFHMADLVELHTSRGLNADAGLDFQDFFSIVCMPSPIEEWVRELPLSQLVADAMPKTDCCSKDQLRHLSRMTQQELNISCDVIKECIAKLLEVHLAELKEVYAKLDSPATDNCDCSEKFQIIKMNVGNIDDFHEGLISRIGEPHLDFEKIMESEHCNWGGCRDSFETGITQKRKRNTCPANEWDITVYGNCALAGMHNSRKVQPIDKLMTKDVVKQANLTREEVIAVVLYTGPMFARYNAALRRWPEDDYQKMKETGNVYTTTISVLVSAVQKIAQAMKLPEGLRLFRGLGGLMDLPKEFFTADPQGRKGFVEWAFMSTTSDEQVAIQFSGAAEGRPLPMVLEIVVGPVDRGACVRELSQYPAQVEYLYLPMSFVSPDGTPRFTISAAGQGVRVVPVRINVNLFARTVEQLRGQKKRMHCSSLRFLRRELDADLRRRADEGGAAARFAADTTKDQDGPHTVGGLIDRIMEQFEAVGAAHEARQAQEYADDAAFQVLVTEMLDARRWAVSKLRLWLEDRSEFICFVMGYSLRVAHRRLTAYLARVAGAAETDSVRMVATIEVCKARGLLQARLEDVNDVGEDCLVAAAADGAAAADIRLLIAAGSAVNGAEGEPSAAAMAAAANGQVDALGALLEAKAAVNASAKVAARVVEGEKGVMH